jgi:ribosome-binding protein aMBF1 (putative translation factor)
VVLPRDEYDRLTALAKAGELPPLPKPDDQGDCQAVEYTRANLARRIIRDRVAAGLSLRKLATMAGVRVETLCRPEAGKHAPNVATVEKIDQALKQYVKSRGRRCGYQPRIDANCSSSLAFIRGSLPCENIYFTRSET